MLWDRACASAPSECLLLVDGIVQNGGPNHAADGCEPARLAAAAAAARCSGLDDLADVIEELPAAASGYDGDHDVFQDHGPLDAALAVRCAATPEDFEPV